MRKVIYYLILMLAFTGSRAKSQLSNFDTSYVIASSPDYDYRNPTHCTNPAENVFTFSFIKNWFSYEKHSNDSTSNIVVRQYDYEGYLAEISLTNDTNVLNINPSISGNNDNYFIVWQSNKRGNWDIFYSILDSGIWSQPILLDSSGGDKTNPKLLIDSYGNYLLVYEKNNNIEIEIYDSYWRFDTTITSPNTVFSYPEFSGGIYSNAYLSSLTEESGMPKRIHCRRIFYNSVTGELTLDEDLTIPIENPGPPSKLPSFGNMITFESFMADVNTSLNNIGTNIPQEYNLHQNYPNPFNPSTKIRFEIPNQVRDDNFVKLYVYNISGKEVARLVNQELAPGVYEYSFDGAELPSGVYFYTLQSGDFVETKRMVLIK